MTWDEIVTWLITPSIVALACGVGAIIWARHIAPSRKE